MNSKEAIEVLDYAANHIRGDNRRGVFIKAFIEGKEWAIEDFKKWRESHENHD